MKVAVTGGCGYIGSHLCRRLKKQGLETVVFDNLEKGHKWLVKQPVYLGDLKKKEEIDLFLEKFEPEVVVHLAAYIEAGESMREPVKYFENNVLGSFNLFKSMQEHNLNKLLYASTAAVYKSKSTPLGEDKRKEPSSVYGKTKLQTEELLKWFGFDSVAFRFFNVAGAHPSGELGQFSQSHLMTRVIGYFFGTLENFRVFGQDYPTKDGTCVRDYVHVEDLVDAFLLALDHLDDLEGFRAYNIGSGKGYSVLEVFNEVKKQLYPERWKNHNFKGFKFGERRPGDPASLTAKISKIHEDWGWEPKRDLEEIVSSALKWHKKHPPKF